MMHAAGFLDGFARVHKYKQHVVQLDWPFCHVLIGFIGLLTILSVLSGCGSSTTDQQGSVPVSLSLSLPQQSAEAASTSTLGGRLWVRLQPWLPTVTEVWAAASVTNLSIIKVEVTGPDIQSPITIEKPISNPTGGQSITIALDVPAGADRVFTVNGFNNQLNIFTGESAPMTLTAGQAAAVDITLIDNTGTITGLVTDATTNAPLIGATMTVNGTSLVPTFTATGNFTLDGIPKGTPTVTVSVPGYTSPTIPPVTVNVGTTSDAGTIALTPRPTGLPTETVIGIKTARGVSAGNSHSCALLLDGTVQCWGNNSSGQLGNGTTIDASSPVVVTKIKALGVSAGRLNSCALPQSPLVAVIFGVECWGDNANGQLGNGTAINASAPVGVTGIDTALSVATGGIHSCALLKIGTIQCWGANFNGELGNGTLTSALAPVGVTGIDTALSVATGDSHSCALISNGFVQCWGANFNGQLGNGNTINASAPVTVIGFKLPAVSVATGDSHSCALISNRSIQCWGANFNGQLGNGATINASAPVTVTGITTALSVATGGSHTCALLADGTVQCWGANFNGQLGDGTTIDKLTPVPVKGIRTALSVATGGSHSCALLSNGTVQCWGANFNGQLGLGFFSPSPPSD